MRLTIAIRTEVADEAEAQVIRDAVEDSVNILPGDDINITAQLSTDVKPTAAP